MKVIEIIRDNYCGHWSGSRSSCRGITVKDGKLLLSYGTNNDKWMIPGGGVEEGEDYADCCVREVSEETGFLVQASACFLEIREYCEDFLFINRYFPCSVIGKAQQVLTEHECRQGLEPRWLPWNEAMEIYGNYRLYADTDEARSGLYFREYTALCEFAKQQP